MLSLIRENIESNLIQIRSYKDFLNRTDYLIIRESEGGAPCPDDTKAARAEARERINSLESEIERLEASLEDETSTTVN